MPGTIDRLTHIIGERRVADPALSYVARLSGRGRAKIAQKVGEEAVETVIAAMAGDRAGVTAEAADLIFHLAILLADMDLTLADVLIELDRRDGISGLTEKAARARE